ncbi:MAG TPA: SDR family NAD(P)-dependent oxidoreductase [Solirubrobacterales bacterium]|jgi:short-subunit dehydrogenase
MESSNARPLAVVTGASTGIGYELAKVFGEEGFDLVIAAQDDELDAAARQLRETDAGVSAHRVDLATEAGVVELHRRIEGIGRPVAALALNAGRGAGGAFATETKLADELEIVDLNVRSTVHLAKLVLPDMVERDEGRILFTSSVAATIPGAFQAVYNASKSFVQSFALALLNELKNTEVSVTALMPGPTDTEFFEVAEMDAEGKNTAVGTEDKDDPAEVARQGFDALMAGKERVVGGSWKNKAQVAVGGLVPDRVKAEMHRKMAEPGTGDGEES